MNDNEIKATLAEVWAEWLMDSSDDHCQSKAIRHLVAAVKASEREWCAKLCDDAAERLRSGGSNHEASAVDSVAEDLRG